MEVRFQQKGVNQKDYFTAIKTMKKDLIKCLEFSKLL